MCLNFPAWQGSYITIPCTHSPCTSNDDDDDDDDDADVDGHGGDGDGEGGEDR
jgi:hypothetical protein